MNDPEPKGGINWWHEARGFLLVILFVLGIHSLVAKPFYIPSESMVPTLLTGDRLLVTKFPYGWSYSSVSFHLAPVFPGKVMGRVPERGDIVVLERPGSREDYIKRVIALPGETIELRAGEVFINGTPFKRAVQPTRAIPVDANMPCNDAMFGPLRRENPDGSAVCEVPVVRETMPNGVSYDTIDLSPDMMTDTFGPYLVPAGHVFLMGDNRDASADSRVPLEARGLGGAVNLDAVNGRAEFITFSMDGTAQWYNPLSWFRAMRSGRAGDTLRGSTD